MQQQLRPSQGTSEETRKTKDLELLDRIEDPELRDELPDGVQWSS